MDKEDKRRIEEYKKNPIANFSDSMNRSVVGDLGQLTKGGCLAKLIPLVIVVILFLIYLNK